MKVEEMTIARAVSQLVINDRYRAFRSRRNTRIAAITFLQNNNNNDNNNNNNNNKIMMQRPTHTRTFGMPGRRVDLRPVREQAIEITRNSFQCIIRSAELVVILFYCPRDRFCQVVIPLFDEVATRIKRLYPDGRKVIMGKVNSETLGIICDVYGIESFPTIKLFRNGEPVGGKYQGPLDPDTLRNYIVEESRDPVIELNDDNELANVNYTNRIIGYFSNKDTPEYINYSRTAHNLKSFGKFYAKFRNNESITDIDIDSPPNNPVIIYKPDSSNTFDREENFNGSASNYDELNVWAHKNLTVQEVTLENLNEFIESRYPCLKLYYHEDNTAINIFKEFVGRYLSNRKHNVHFVFADYSKFPDCLRKYDKIEEDLPLVAIEFRDHAFSFAHPLDIDNPQHLLEFLNNFDTGKLQYMKRMSLNESIN